MWELDYKESWVLKNWCFWTVVSEKALESPLDCKEIQPVHPKGSQSWIFIRRTDAETEVSMLWPPDAKNWLTGKDHDAGENWRQENGMTEDEMVGWHHQLYGHEFEQALGVCDGQGSLVCCSPWDHKQLGMTWLSDWTELKVFKNNCNTIVCTEDFTSEWAGCKYFITFSYPLYTLNLSILFYQQNS